MGTTLRTEGQAIRAAVEVHGTEELKSVQIVAAGRAVREVPFKRGEHCLSATVELPATRAAHYYVRVTQADGERAWSSPIFFD